jgi:hypothetical protein
MAVRKLAAAAFVATQQMVQCIITAGPFLSRKGEAGPTNGTKPVHTVTVRFSQKSTAQST